MTSGPVDESLKPGFSKSVESILREESEAKLHRSGVTLTFLRFPLAFSVTTPLRRQIYRSRGILWRLSVSDLLVSEGSHQPVSAGGSAPSSPSPGLFAGNSTATGSSRQPVTVHNTKGTVSVSVLSWSIYLRLGKQRSRKVGMENMKILKAKKGLTF